MTASAGSAGPAPLVLTRTPSRLNCTRNTDMTPCRLDDLNGWLEEEAATISEDAFRTTIIAVNASLERFVNWPQRAELLWSCCDRKPEKGKKQRYHRFPDLLKPFLRQYKFTDRRSNGSAKLAYLVTEGERPLRANGNGWHIHHLYDGQFPYPGGTHKSLRAVWDPVHFTQSAGVVAIHPVADALADEFAVFAWRLRAEAFLRFGYDPEGVFSDAQDAFGFAGVPPVKVWI